MALPIEHSIITDVDCLNEKHIPQTLFGREDQIERLRFCLSSVFSRRKPINVWLYGPPGSGKTAIARRLLMEIVKTNMVHGVYVNCWERNSLHAVLDKVIDELRIFGAERPDAGFKLERLRKFLKDAPLILVLDEIDQPCPKDRNAILYNFSTLENIGLVCISNSRYFLFSLDDRIKSRLNATQIEFGKYSDAEILNILTSRAMRGLESGTWDEETLEEIAGMSHGDARIAIQTLRNAAYYAETDNTSRILDEHVRKAWTDARVSKKSYLLNKMSKDHKILFELIRTRKVLQSNILYQSYLLECAKRKAQPIAQRTYYEYLARLEQSGLIQSQGSGSGNRPKAFRILE